MAVKAVHVSVVVQLGKRRLRLRAPRRAGSGGFAGVRISIFAVKRVLRRLDQHAIRLFVDDFADGDRGCEVRLDHCRFEFLH